MHLRLTESAPDVLTAAHGLDPELAASCAARADLFQRCFTRYAEAMDQITDALGQYERMLADGPRWVRS